MSGADTDLQSLTGLSRKELEEQWRNLFKSPSPIAYTPDLLRRGLAYRLQEKAKGGLDKSFRDRLQARSVPSANTSSLRPGNRLVRRWRGKDYIVEVSDKGFEHEGQHFGSLSEIATHITGTRWSGPRFFGLKT